MKLLDKLRIVYNKKRNKIPEIIVIYIISKLEEGVKNGKKYQEFRIHMLEKINIEVMKQVEDNLKLMGINTIIKKHDCAYYFDEYKFYWE